MIRGLDHVAITAQDMEATIAFYGEKLGCELLFVDAWRSGEFPIVTIRLGANMLNVHDAAAPASPHARLPTPGAQDLCFRWDGPIAAAQAFLETRGIPIELGPVPRMAPDMSAAESVYVRDPDGNLLELLTTEV